jgi:hypothetical protein
MRTGMQSSVWNSPRCTVVCAQIGPTLPERMSSCLSRLLVLDVSHNRLAALPTLPALVELRAWDNPVTRSRDGGTAASETAAQRLRANIAGAAAETDVRRMLRDRAWRRGMQALHW